MRLLLALALALHPLAAQAQTIRPPPRSPAPMGRAFGGAAPGAPNLSLGPDLGPAVLTPLLPVLPWPGAPLPGAAAVPAASIPSPETAPAAPASPVLPERLQAVADAVAQDVPGLGHAPAEAASAAGERQLLLLQGASPTSRQVLAEEPVSAEALALGGAGLSPALPESGATPAEPPLPEPERKASVRQMFLGTAAYKLGMESVTLAFPLFALQALGGAAMVATLVVAYGLAQAASSSLAGALTDRFPASRVVAGAVAGQAILVTAAAGLAMAGAVTAGGWVLMYGLVGGAVGVAETARRLVPPLILGQEAKSLAQYNARLHIYYETAGVGGALLAGLLLWTAGPAAALLLPPLPLLAAAAVFRKVRHGFRAAEKPRDGLAPQERLLERFRGYIEDIRLGARTILASPYFRWAALAMILPQVIHRVFEGVLVPVYARGILGQGALASAVLAASNLGELIGAWLLLRRSSGARGPGRWVRWSALGLLAAWSMALAALLPLPVALALLLPSIVVFSLTWAAADLRLLTDVQHRLGEKERARALSFLYGLFMVSVTLGSLGLGRFLDVLPLSTAFLWVQGAITAIAVLVWLASRRLQAR